MNEEYGLNYYPYIQEFPHYIHNDTRNLLNTANTIFDTNNKNINNNINNHPYVRAIIDYQRQREDNILSILGLKNGEDIQSLFERLGLIEKGSLQESVMHKINELSETRFYKEELKIRNELKRSGKPSDYQKELEEIYKGTKQEIDRIVKEVNNIMLEATGDNQIKLSILKKLVEFSETEFDNTKENYGDLLYKHVNGLQGKLSVWSSSIMEDFKEVKEQDITEDFESEFTLLQKADTYRSKNVKGAYNKAKADRLIIKKGEDFIYPIGGISDKKIKKDRIKLHTTTDIMAFLNYLEKNSGYIPEKELKKDLLELEYLLRNGAFYSIREIPPVGRALSLLGSKYLYIFITNGIYKQILEEDNIDNNLEDLNRIFSFEHADFIFVISTKNGTKVSRVSDEIENILKNYNNTNIGTNFSSDKPMGRTNALKELEEIKNLKTTINPYTYKEAIQNSLIIDKMDKIKNYMKSSMEIRVDIPWG